MRREVHCYVPLGGDPSEQSAMGYGDIADVDPAEEVARVATARRPRLLRLYRRRLRFEDLEDCYSQATLELLARSRGAPFYANPEHLGNLHAWWYVADVLAWAERYRARYGPTAGVAGDAAPARSADPPARQHGNRPR
jgi:hypothetical protein